MPTPRPDQIESPLKELSETASEQALVLARQQVELLTTRVRQAAPAAAMVGGAAFLGVLASGTGTAALVLLLARRPGASAAALGVTGAYAGAGALLAREGLDRLRTGALASGDTTEDTVQDADKTRGSAKRSATSPAKSPTRSTSRQASTAAKRGASRKAAKRVRQRAAKLNT